MSLQSISQNDTAQLLPNPVLAYVNPGVSHVWLPTEACALFEHAFNLTYNETLDRYLIDDTTRQTLLSANTKLNFNITGPTSNSSVQIEIPYAAFDLELNTYPDVDNATDTESLPYFPLRRAENSSQYTLGRTFLQGAYLITDYERSEFYLHQAIFPTTQTAKDIRTILPLPTSPQNSSTNGNVSPSPSNILYAGTLVGIVVGSVLLLAIICLTFYIVRRHCLRVHLASETEFSKSVELDSDEKLELPAPDAGAVGLYTGELHGDHQMPPELESYPRFEMDACEQLASVELPGTGQAGHNLGSRNQ